MEEDEHVSLTRRQLATILGVSCNQTRHWTQQGYIPNDMGIKPRRWYRYSFDDLVHCFIVRDLIEAGVTGLKAAAIAWSFHPNGKPDLTDGSRTVRIEVDVVEIERRIRARLVSLAKRDFPA
jgi:DNA-binding transcriptional MerR regulator